MMIDKFRRAKRAEFMKTHEELLVMALKPKFAKAIYDGKKQWEFRKAPPPLMQPILIYETAPVSKITGVVVFSFGITGERQSVWNLATLNRLFTKNLPGIGYESYLQYCGKRETCTALRVEYSERYGDQCPLNAAPPQNWGKYYIPKDEPAAKEGGVR